mgnify:CR=1 FL=1
MLIVVEGVALLLLLLLFSGGGLSPNPELD